MNDDFEPWLGRGIELKRHRRHGLAEAAFERAASIDRDRAEVWRHLGGMAMIFGRWEAALQAFGRALEIDSEKNTAIKRKEAVSRVLKSEARRQEWHEKAAELRKEWEEIFAGKRDVWQSWERDHLDREEIYKEGALLLDDNRYEDALDVFEQVIEEVPDHVRAWNKKGVALRELGRFQEALAAHRRAVEINPEHAIAQLNKQVSLEKYRQWEQERARPVIRLSAPEENMLVMEAAHKKYPAMALPALLDARRGVLPSELQNYGDAASLLFKENPDSDSVRAARNLAGAPHDQVMELFRLSDDQERYWLKEVPHMVSKHKAYRYYVLLLAVKGHQRTARSRTSPGTGRTIEFPKEGRLQDPDWAFRVD